jgi:citrate lyase subunit beta / citryl-CoA lyase
MTTSELIATARTFLFVPGDRPERFGKAAASGADVVILDLEDAVGPEHKPEARDRVREWLDRGHRAVVRVNAPGTRWFDDDVATAAENAQAVLVPKADDPAVLSALARRLPAGTGIIPLIETAAGIVRAAQVCAAPSVIRPAFGNVDLSAQIGVDHRSHAALGHARSALVLAAAAAGCAAPIDGVTTAIRDEAVLRADVEHAVTLGFTAKMCIHPGQVAVVHDGFAPSAEEIAWARGIVESTSDGSVTVHDGQMIDRPVLLRARSILARV